MTLLEYIEKIRSHNMVGGSKAPWYVLMSNEVPQNSEREDSPVRFDIVPTPDFIHFAFEKLASGGGGGGGRAGVTVGAGQEEGAKSSSSSSSDGQNTVEARNHFVNVHWGIGVEGSGAAVHFHAFAWNAIVYGAKKWYIYPPHDRIMSNKQILSYIEDGDMLKMEKEKGARRIECVQTAGDILFIPQSWGHGVLNLQETVSVASEAANAVWKQSPMLKTAKQLGAI